MKYYSLEIGIAKKVIGKHPQCNDTPRFNDPSGGISLNKLRLKKAGNLKVITDNAIINKKAKLTDLINPSSNFRNLLLISTKLKKVLEKFGAEDFEFFKSPVIFEGKEIDDYWLMNPVNDDLSIIDFEKSTFALRRNENDKREILKFKTKEEYLALKNQTPDQIKKDENGILYRLGLAKNEIILKTKFTKHIFYSTSHPNWEGSSYYVSEKVKQAIEEIGCTNVEFRPMDLPKGDWKAYRHTIYGEAY
ncbi:imm11 family protein [Aquimarina algiphila]|uniref:Immunity MXAN-0049 protein domain-containing protein n=1 Tax=Aquimarina algiphila TaxID=2047982 RepID=A0A554VNN5_9FLAO|nr:DUF1629 domain-containing protein [Aquimarina algiphila]TSE09989.1 hypothetical protein FOF46_06725 [Aquimarina algiphila]